MSLELLNLGGVWGSPGGFSSLLRVWTIQEHRQGLQWAPGKTLVIPFIDIFTGMFLHSDVCSAECSDEIPQMPTFHVALLQLPSESGCLGLPPVFGLRPQKHQLLWVQKLDFQSPCTGIHAAVAGGLCQVRTGGDGWRSNTPWRFRLIQGLMLC